jgi:hypothetical protein
MQPVTCNGATENVAPLPNAARGHFDELQAPPASQTRALDRRSRGATLSPDRRRRGPPTSIRGQSGSGLDGLVLTFGMARAPNNYRILG